MTDEVLKELWEAKDSIARAHGYDMDALARYYQKRQAARLTRFKADPERGTTRHTPTGRA